jgi:hypothetical protein
MPRHAAAHETTPDQSTIRTSPAALSMATCEGCCERPIHHPDFVMVSARQRRAGRTDGWTRAQRALLRNKRGNRRTLITPIKSAVEKLPHQKPKLLRWLVHDLVMIDLADLALGNVERRLLTSRQALGVEVQVARATPRLAGAATAVSW